MVTDTKLEANAAAKADEEPVPSGDGVSREVLPSEVLARLLPELNAIPAAQLIQVNAGIPLTVATALGSLPKIVALREAIMKVAPGYDIALFDKLEDAAIALNEAHGNYLSATKPADEFYAVLQESTALRETLLTDAQALAHRGLLDVASFDDLKGAVGHLNVATDLSVLQKALQAKWPKIAGKAATTLKELERAQKLQINMIRLYGLKKQSEAATAAAAEVRLRAFTYFLRIYDHVQRGVTFVSWENKAFEQIVPTLYANRGRRRATDQADDELEPVPPVDAEGSVTPPTAAGTTPVAGRVAPAASPRTGQGGPSTPEEDPFL